MSLEQGIMELATKDTSNKKRQTTKRKQDAMEKKWCLLKESDGARGDAGKKKIYEVRIEGSTLRCEWGMAEKTSRQSSVQTFYSENAAMQQALDKVYAKLDKGYKLAFVV
jgi:predicted DNA-binding WGR domain protein